LEQFLDGLALDRDAEPFDGFCELKKIDLLAVVADL
jgi:hypothetical protein